MKRYAWVVCAWALCCGTVFAGEEKLRVASLSSVLTDLAMQVGGEQVEIIPILPAGVDPHLYEPTPGDIRKMTEADMILANGLGFETYLDKLRQSVGSKVNVVVVGDFMENPLRAEECAADHDHDHGHHHGDTDPHWWHSVGNAKQAVGVLRDTFAKADPENSERFNANANRILESMNELERWIRVELASLPKDKRVLVTSHDALGYFARDYEFVVLPVYGISTSEQPSSQKVRNLIDSIRARKVNSIFAESLENPRVLQEIMRETGAKLGGALYTDGLGHTEAITYDAMMRHNVKTIVSGLQ